jgi:hypothetical protein
MSGSSSSVHDLLVHFNGVDGATAYTAESGQILTFAADAQLDTAQKMFGTASLLLDGTGDYVTVPNEAAWSLGTDDFTLDFWVRPNISNGTDYILFDSSPTGQIKIQRDTDNTLRAIIGGTAHIFGTWTPANANWYHIALVRSGANAYMFVNGIQLGATWATADYSVTITGGLVIGAKAGGTVLWNGHIDEVSLMCGTAAWVTDFVVPSAEYSASNVKAVSGVTQAATGVLTVDAHGYTGGEEIYVDGIVGMTELNLKWFLVVYINANTFSLTDLDGTAIDTSAYTAYVSGGTVEALYEIDTPYAEDDIDELQFAQKADLMYIVHPNYEPRKLIRSGDANWAVSVYTRTADPFTTAVTNITQADPGVVTAAAHGYENGDIVELWGVVGMTEVNGHAYKVANKAADTFQLTDSVTGANVDTSGYTAYTSGGKTFKSGNMPGAAAFYGGRLFFGGTDDEPESFWGSKAPTNAGVTQYDDFTVGTSEGDGLTFPISSQNNMADRIQWFAGTSRFLGIGTYGGVYKANGGSDSTPISGIDISVSAVEFVGCKYVAPVRVGSSIFYIQRGGLILNNFAFSFMADDYRASSLNIFSDEITKTGMNQLTVQQGVADIIWACTAEGKLIGLTVKTGEEINAWHEHKLGGTDVKVLSVCGEPQPDNKDSLWVVVERTINSLTRRYIEYMDADTVLPEDEDYYTGEANETVDDTYYEAVLYEEAKKLIRVDSSIFLDGLQAMALTPAAVTGTGIAFTTSIDMFAVSDVGRYIIKKKITGAETGRALITAYVSAQQVTCTITETFNSVTAIPSNEWYLTFTSITGLDHLEGESVTAQVDGSDDGVGYTVASGTITLSSPATAAHIGLKYKGRLTTMPLNIGALAGTAQGRITTVNRLGLLFRHTRDTYYGTNLYRLEQVKDRDISPALNRPPRLKTQVDFLNIPDGYDRRKFVHIIQDTADPCTVQGIVPYVDTTNE